MSDSGNDIKAAINHQETAKRGGFYLGEGAKMTYTRPSAELMKVNNTLVDEQHRGKGLAHQLYHAMVQFARENQRKVIPVCPFVVAMFKKNPGDADVLKT